MWGTIQGSAKFLSGYLPVERVVYEDQRKGYSRLINIKDNETPQWGYRGIYDLQGITREVLGIW